MLMNDIMEETGRHTDGIARKKERYQQMIRKTFPRTTPYLHIPVFDRDPKMFPYIRVMDGEQPAQEFHIGIVDPACGERPDFYVQMYLGNYTGDTVTLCCEDGGSPTMFDGIVPGEDMEEEPELYPDLYHEPERQQIHFSPRRGWMNDPNGLVCTKDGYDIYFQHNPFGPHHGCTNVSWGHAVSPDGVHFKEYPDAIMPYSSRCHVASGSAVKDRYNLSGFGTDTLIAAYTALQSVQYHDRPPVVNEGQLLLYSTDGGMTFHYFEKNPIIPVPEGEEWRDPKIIQTGDGSLCIGVYETYKGENCVSFYRSTDLKEWTLMSREMDLFECPDLFPLEVEETGEVLWVLYGGNGKYRIGRFEDYHFTAFPQKDVLYLDYGLAVYAGQTWNDPPDLKERLHMAWMADNQRKWNYAPECLERGKGYSQSMSLVCSLKLHKTPLGYRLFRTPIPALKTLRQGIGQSVSVRSGDLLNAPAEYLLNADPGKPLTVLFGDQGLSYDPQTGSVACIVGEDKPTWMMFSNVNSKEIKRTKLTKTDELSLHLYTDRRSVEVFLNGEISMSFSSLTDTDRVSVIGQKELGGTVYRLNSIWK